MAGWWILFLLVLSCAVFIADAAIQQVECSWNSWMWVMWVSKTWRSDRSEILIHAPKGQQGQWQALFEIGMINIWLIMVGLAWVCSKMPRNSKISLDSSASDIMNWNSAQAVAITMICTGWWPKASRYVYMIYIYVWSRGTLFWWDVVVVVIVV